MRQIYTTTDGRALDTISLSREFERDEDEQRRANRIADSIEKALRGELRLPDVVTKRSPAQGPHQGLRAGALGHHQQPVVAPLHHGGGAGPRPHRAAL